MQYCVWRPDNYHIYKTKYMCTLSSSINSMHMTIDILVVLPFMAKQGLRSRKRAKNNILSNWLKPCFSDFFFRFVYCHKTHSDTYRLYQVHKIQYDTGNIRNKSTSNIFISHTLFLLLDHWKEKNIWNIVWLTSQSTTVQLLEGKQKYPTTVVFVTNKNFCNINQVHYLQQKTNNQVI